jgi:hypothetical protein
MNWRLPILPLYVILIYFAGIGFANKTTDNLSEFCPVAHFENAHEHGWVVHHSENSWYNDTEDDHDSLAGIISQPFFVDVANAYHSRQSTIVDANPGQLTSKRFILFRSILI